MSLRLITITSLFLVFPLTTFAQFQPLVGIPGVPTQNANFSDYMNALYGVAISLAALLAVVKIIIAGAKYMLSDVVTTKEDAKRDIKGALFGLLIVLAAVLILYTINPQLLRNNIILDRVSVERVERAANLQTYGNTPLGTNSFGVGDRVPAAVLTPSDLSTLNSSCSSDGGNLRTVNGPNGSEVVCMLGDGVGIGAATQDFPTPIPDSASEQLFVLGRITDLIGSQVGRTLDDNPDRLVGAFYVEEEIDDPFAEALNLENACIESTNGRANGTDVFYVEGLGPNGETTTGGTFFCVNTT